MSKIMQVKTAELPINALAAADGSDKISIRVSPNGYVTALFLSTFLTSFLIYAEYDAAAIVLMATSWSVIPYLAWSDRICFDGKYITRIGFLPRFWAALGGSRSRLRITDIEQVETQALRALKRGGNVFYRYRTSIKGKKLKFSFASGGEEYRRITQRIFAVLPENALDNRSLELRDFLREPKETLMKAEFAKIPSAEVLETSLMSFKLAGANAKSEFDATEIEKAGYLHRLGNELRLGGYLLQSLEAFRRALFLTPRDAWLIYDFGRCLHSFAGSERDKRLARRAFAALRLAEKRGSSDYQLLARLGESYFQYEDLKRARAAFRKSLDAGDDNFRSIKGLAEISLREGKIAHVIHHFATAHRLAETPPLKRWTENETAYFSRLNDDEEYMELEVSRVNTLEILENFKKVSLKIGLASFPAILFGLVLNDELIINFGWAISIIALLIWVGIIVGISAFSMRVPLNYADED